MQMEVFISWVSTLLRSSRAAYVFYQVCSKVMIKAQKLLSAYFSGGSSVIIVRFQLCPLFTIKETCGGKIQSVSAGVIPARLVTSSVHNACLTLSYPSMIGSR